MTSPPPEPRLQRNAYSIRKLCQRKKTDVQSTIRRRGTLDVGFYFAIQHLYQPRRQR
jgi:hypothetical protein